MELTLNFFIILAFAWCCARWAHRVSNKLPGWMHQDWLNQAETFIAQKDDAMNPDAPPADVSHVAAAPSYKWWTPFRVSKSTHSLSFLPFIGPFLEKDYRGAWSEVWICLCTAMLVVVMGSTPGISLEGKGLLVFGGIFYFAMLQALTNVDYKTQYLPDILVYPVLWLGLLVSVLANNFITPTLAIEGAVMGYMSLWMLSTVFSVLLKKPTMGGGDLKLLAAIGAWVGPFGVLLTLGLSSFIALGYALMLVIRKKPANRFAYGPSLATAGVLIFITLPFLIGHLKDLQ